MKFEDLKIGDIIHGPAARDLFLYMGNNQVCSLRRSTGWRDNDDGRGFIPETDCDYVLSGEVVCNLIDIMKKVYDYD